MKGSISKLFGVFPMVTLVIFWAVVDINAATTGKIAGRVLDANTGEGLPGANVIIEGTAMGAAADPEGNYFIINVPPGVYTLRAKMIGYKTILMTEVKVQIDLTTSLDFETDLEVIEGEEISIVSIRPVVQADISGSERNIDIEEIVAGRYQNINNLITAQVSVQSISSTDYRPNIRGSSIEESLFLIDGVEQGDPLTNRPFYKVNLDAIQEVKIQTGGFTAKYGNFQSGILNVVTREGGQSYHGSANVQYSAPGLKHFGAMPFGHDSPLVQPFVNVWDASGNFDLTAPSNTGDGMTANGDPISTFFEGWNDVANERITEGEPHFGMPMEVYARYLWRHRSEDSINKLKELEEMGVVKFADGINPDDEVFHETGVDADYNLSFTFGGPVPGLNQINKTTFFVTFDQVQSEYAYRTPQRSYKDREFRGKATTWFGDNIKLNLRGYWSRQKGGDGGQGPGLDGRISFSPFNAVGSENKFWYPHCAVTGQQTRQIYGLDLIHSLSANTFYEVKLSHYRTDYEMLRELRNTAPSPGTTGQFAGRFGDPYANGLPTSATAAGVQQGMIGSTAEAESNAARGDEGWENWRDWAKIQIGDYWYDEAPRGYGPVNWRDITGEYRMESCNLRNNDTYSRSFDLAASIMSQVNRHNQIEAGFQIRKDRVNQVYEAIDPSVNSGGISLAEKIDEWRGGVYLQDKLEYEGFIANLGLRADWIKLGDYPQLNVDTDANGNAIDAADIVSGPYSDFLLPGNTLDPDQLDERGNPIFNTFNVIPLKSGTKVRLSPRLGISHPISDVAKIFFNYGHMYQWPNAFRRYRIQYDTRRGNRIEDYGNPALDPPRTIAYELGYEHNLFDKMSLRLTGYFKDVNNKADNLRFHPLDHGGNYEVRTNQEFSDIRGLETYLELRRNVLPYVSGWASLNWLVESEGSFGFDRIWEDPSRQPRKVSSQVSNPDVRPLIKLNFNLNTPKHFGPSLGDKFSLFGNINLNLLYSWKRGNQFTWNPAEIPLVEDNMRWKAYQRWDLRLNKDLFRAGSVQAIFYLDVMNLFNNKNMTHPRRIEGSSGGRSSRGNTDNRTDDDWAWDGHKWWNNQVRGYLESLGYTDENQNSDGSFNNTNGSPGDNKGDLPGFTPWTFLEKRDVFFGVRFYF